MEVAIKGAKRAAKRAIRERPAIGIFRGRSPLGTKGGPGIFAVFFPKGWPKEGGHHLLWHDIRLLVPADWEHSPKIQLRNVIPFSISPPCLARKEEPYVLLFRWNATRWNSYLSFLLGEVYRLALKQGPIGLKQNQDIEQHPHRQTHKQMKKMLLEKKRKNKRVCDCPIPQAA